MSSVTIRGESLNVCVAAAVSGSAAVARGGIYLINGGFLIPAKNRCRRPLGSILILAL